MEQTFEQSQPSPDITPEVIQQATEYALVADFSPLVNEEDLTSQNFITQQARYIRAHGTRHVLTSFYRNSDGELRLGIFVKPNDESDEDQERRIAEVGNRAIWGQMRAPRRY